MYMKIKILLILSLITVYNAAVAQDEDIVKIIDDLTIKWDEEAKDLETYEGLKKYCRDKAYRDNTI